MLRFGCSRASSRDRFRLVKTSIQPFCRTWSRNYVAAAAEESKRFIDVTKYQKELVKILINSKRRHWLNSRGRKEVQDIRQGTRMAVDSVVASLKSRAQHITKFEEIAQFGTAASNGDSEIGELIAKAFEKGWGNDLQVLADRNASHNELQLYMGMTLDSGYLLPHFITNHKTKECVLKKPRILIHEKKVLNYDIMFDLLRHVAPQRGHKGRDVLIVAEDIEYDRLASLVLHGMSTGTKVCVIKPRFGESRKASLRELTELTGGKVIPEEFDPNSFSWNFLGHAEKIKVSKDQAVILRCPFSSEYGQWRFTMENLQDFPAKRSNVVAVLKVGGTNKVEVREKRDRAAYAVNATKTTKEEGVGDGFSLLYAYKHLDKLQTTNSGQKIGVRTIQSGLEALLLRTAASCAGVEVSVIFHKLKEQSNPNPAKAKSVGCDDIRFPQILDKLLNQAKDGYVDMLLRKFVFPLETIRTVLVVAASKMLRDC